MRYSITVDSDREEISRVLGILFSYGYVFHYKYRFKTVEDFFQYYEMEGGENFVGWNYICMGTDKECKMVLEAYTEERCNSDPISIEDYIKLCHPSFIV